jgi:hypothetical protein
VPVQEDAHGEEVRAVEDVRGAARAELAQEGCAEGHERDHHEGRMSWNGSWCATRYTPGTTKLSAYA